MKIPRWIVPMLVLVAAGAGIGGARLFAAPSFTKEFSALGATARPATVRMTVRGLKCVDTARSVAGQLDGVPGVIRYVAHASRNEAQVTYDPARTSPEAIAEAIEGPVFVPETGEILFHQYEVLSIRSSAIE
jgi:copper chaperone CopZ